MFFGSADALQSSRPLLEGVLWNAAAPSAKADILLLTPPGGFDSVAKLPGQRNQGGERAHGDAVHGGKAQVDFDDGAEAADARPMERVSRMASNAI
jgi:hypothetical protein